MKFAVFVIICMAWTVNAVPHGQDFLDYILRPLNRVRWSMSRIVGGDATEITKYPYQASLQLNGRHICGCNVISKRFILTAAHCTDGSNANSLSVKVGSSFHAQGGTNVQVSRIIQHSKFDSWVIDYDYSILELEQELEFSDSVQPIEILCQGENYPDGTIVSTSGWGTTQNINESNNKLRVVHVEIINQSACEKAYDGVGAPITDSGYLEDGGKDACQGDSGGPLALGHNQNNTQISNVLRVDGKNVLIGLVSWGFGCAQPLFPGVYSRVSEASDWIMKETGLKKCHKIKKFKFFNPLMRI